jgi:ankyrin repeat protein
MRESPDIDQLKRQARELLEAYRDQSPDAVIEVAAHHRTATPETFALHDAQFVLARSYGFESWPKLKAAVDGVTTTRLHEAVQRGDLGAARALLARRPEIVDLLRGGPSGFEIRALHIAVMQRNVEMTRLLLEAGADTRGGIWPNRDATSPRTIAQERGYDEIVAMMVAQEEKRGAREERTPLDFAASECAEGLLQAAVRSGRLAVLRQLLETGLDPDERTQIGHHEDQTFSTGGPLMEAVNIGRIDMARVLLEHGADPNAQVFTSGSPTFAAYSGGSPRTHAPDSVMIDLMLKHGGWIDAASVGYLREVEIARRMLAGELDPHLELGTFSGETVAEQILWSGASGRCVDIVRMALARIDWPRDDLRWFWMLWRPLPGHQDLNEAEQADCRESFRLILARCDPNLRAGESGQTMLHEVIARDHGVGVSLASLLLDAGARTDVRDEFLKSTPLGWACRWGRVELVKLLLARGADPIESEAEPWATPLVWAERRQHARIASILRQDGADR